MAIRTLNKLVPEGGGENIITNIALVFKIVGGFVIILYALFFLDIAARNMSSLIQQEIKLLQYLEDTATQALPDERAALEEGSGTPPDEPIGPYPSSRYQFLHGGGLSSASLGQFTSRF